LRIKNQFLGISEHRLDREPLEKRFAEAWQRLNDTSNSGRGKSTLDYLMDKDSRGVPDPPLTDRDWLVASTVIQWLGSPVGQCFISEVITLKEGKPFLERLVSVLEERDSESPEEP